MKNKQITIIDVAQAAGVSIATVSNVLNRRNVPLTEETIKKVEEAAARLGYRRNVMAANLSRRKTYELGLLLPYFSGYFGEFAHVMQRTVHEWGYHLSVHASMACPDMEQRHLETLLQRRVDGLFCHGLAMSPELTRTVVGEGTPLVLFNAWGWPEDLALGAVNLNFVEGSGMLVRHLAERGCRRLYYLGHSVSRGTNEQRVIGFTKAALALQTAGAIESYALYDTDHVDSETILAELAAAMEQGEPVGILAFDDFEAFIWISRLRERGYRVPEQCKVAGINNQPIAQHNSPSITSLSYDMEAQARLAAELLFIELGEAKADPTRHPAEPRRRELSLPMKLVERASTR